MLSDFGTAVFEAELSVRGAFLNVNKPSRPDRSCLLFECKSSEETSELVSQVLIAAIFEKPTVFFQTISTVVRAGELGRSLVK